MGIRGNIVTSYREPDFKMTSNAYASCIKIKAAI